MSKLKDESEEAKIAKLYYLMNYSRHYSELLKIEGLNNNKGKIIAELFLFRSWFIQLLYSIFTDQEISEGILQNIVNDSDTLGKGILKQVEGIDIEFILGREFMYSLNERWTFYDNVFIANKSTKGVLPFKEIFDSLVNVLQLRKILADNFFLAYTFLVEDLLNLQKEIKNLISYFHYGGQAIN